MLALKIINKKQDREKLEEVYFANTLKGKTVGKLVGKTEESRLIYKP